MKTMTKVVLGLLVVALIALPVLSDSWSNTRPAAEATYQVPLSTDLGDDNTLKTATTPYGFAGQWHCTSYLDDGFNWQFSHDALVNGTTCWLDNCPINIDDWTWVQLVSTGNEQPTYAQVHFFLELLSN